MFGRTEKLPDEPSHQEIHGVRHDDEGNEKTEHASQHQSGIGPARSEIMLGPAEGPHEFPNRNPIDEDEEAEDDADDADGNVHRAILRQQSTKYKSQI